MTIDCGTIKLLFLGVSHQMTIVVWHSDNNITDRMLEEIRNAIVDIESIMLDQ
jgi:hypothetical protein